nr:insulinase family protein [Chloroflexota bacterium]
MSAGEVTLPQIHRTEVDGVAVFWSPAPGPLTCGLMFRVGRADETLPTAGITHMLEHLTMARFGTHDDDSNAFVDETRTLFHASEGERDVMAFLGQVTAALLEPDVARLDMERGILLDEARSRSVAVDSELRRLRFGATGHGLPGLPEFGLRTVTPEAVTDWARSRFTAANAALVLSGPVPAGLSLTLASGSRHGAVPPIPID